MATYTYDPSDLANPLNAVRLALGDTGPNWLLCDEEITHLINTEGADSAVSSAAYAISAKYAQYPDQRTGRIDVKYSQLAKHYKDLGDRLKETGLGSGLGPTEVFVGGIKHSENCRNDENTDLVQGQFGIGQFDDPQTTFRNGDDYDERTRSW